ncbi:hypothetical protein HDU93_003538 [Gonapodya sp. JEL0774]|nr:hypothetical protein HDU93_003538 [Gonapodya sp. JEL0774]
MRRPVHCKGPVSRFMVYASRIAACLCTNVDLYAKCVAECPTIINGTSIDDFRSACKTVSRLSGTVIGGIVLAVALTIILIIGVVYFFISRKGRARSARYGASYQPMHAKPFRGAQAYQPTMVPTGPGGFEDESDEEPSYPKSERLQPPSYQTVASVAPGSNALHPPAPPAIPRSSSKKFAAPPLMSMSSAGGVPAGPTSSGAPSAPPLSTNIVTPPGFTPGSTYTVKTQGYSSTESDELSVRYGDSVRVEQVYDDGWAFGFNISTGKQGMFPWGALSGK